MRKMIFALVMMLTAVTSARAMSYEQARNEALFLTDKMAYELNLTDAQYEAAYEINLDYLMGVTSQADVFGTYWERRNMDLSYILYSWQWDMFRAATYFYRPLYWDRGYWHFGIYARYPHRDYFYFGRPHFYATYRGAHSWHFNGGRSYYHGRDHHFRPSVPSGRQHFGMRNSFDRGDYRGSRNGSSTRITGHQGRGSSGRGYSIGSDNNRRFGSDNNRRFGSDNNRRLGTDRGSVNSGINNRNSTSAQPNRSMGNSTMERGNNGSRHFGGSRSTGSMGTRSVGSMGTRSTGSIGTRSVGSMGTRSAVGPSTGSRTSGGSNRSSNSHGHFGGSRN